VNNCAITLHCLRHQVAPRVWARFLALALAGMLVLVGLPMGAGAATTAVGTARLRVIDLAAFTNPTQGIRLYLDGALQASTLGFGSSSAYTTLWAGRHHVQIFAAATGKPVLDTAITLLAAHDYSYLIEGRLQGTVWPVLAQDDTTPPAAGQARVRFANAIPTGSAVTAHLSGGTATFGTTAFTGLSAYRDVPAGPYALEVNLPTGQAVMTLSPVALAPGQVYTLVATGLTSAGTPTNVAQAGTMIILSAMGSQIASASPVLPATASNAANLRLVDLLPTTLIAEPVTLVLDGQSFVGSLGYGSASTYVRLAAGVHHIQVSRLSGGAPLLDTTVTLAASSDSSYVLHQLTATTIGATLTSSEASAPAATSARLRLSNMTVGGQAVRAVLVSFANFGTIADGGFSPYVRVPAPGHYTLQVFSTNGALLTTIPELAVSGGQSYTLFTVTGLANSTPVVAISSVGGQVISPVSLQAPALQPSVPLSPAPVTAAQPAARTTAALRVTNLLRGLPTQTALFYVDGHPFAGALGFGGSTVFGNLPAGRHHMEVFGANGHLLINTTLDLKAGTSATFAAEGMQSGPARPALLSLAHHITAAQGQAMVRFANAMPGASTLRATFVNKRINLGSAPFAGVGSYRAVPAGTYTLMVRTISGLVILTVPHVTLQAGARYTIFASGTGAGNVGAEAIVLPA
jgi:hypothetical protein